MKKTFGILMVLLSMNAFGFDYTGQLKAACSQGCTPEMKEIHDAFLNSKSGLKTNPGAFSGKCYDLSKNTKPNDPGYLTTFYFDNNEEGSYFVRIGEYYAQDTYESLIREVKGLILAGRTTPTKITHEDTISSYLKLDGWELERGTWIKEDLKTNEILLISHASSVRYGYYYAPYKYYEHPYTTFCKLKPNPTK